MNWRFCPHCETQLDDETGICPACRWDPLEAPAPAQPEPEPSLMERYRGTEYDTLSAMAPAVAEHRAPGGLTKGRLWLLAGVLVLFGIYGGMIAWMTVRDAMDQPAVPAGVTAPR